MKKMFLFLFSLLCVSCSSDDLDETIGDKKQSTLVYVEGVAIKREGDILSFNNHEDFLQVVNSLKDSQKIYVL